MYIRVWKKLGLRDVREAGRFGVVREFEGVSDSERMPWRIWEVAVEDAHLLHRFYHALRTCYGDSQNFLKYEETTQLVFVAYAQQNGDPFHQRPLVPDWGFGQLCHLTLGLSNLLQTLGDANIRLSRDALDGVRVLDAAGPQPAAFLPNLRPLFDDEGESCSALSLLGRFLHGGLTGDLTATLTEKELSSAMLEPLCHGGQLVDACKMALSLADTAMHDRVSMVDFEQGIRSHLHIAMTHLSAEIEKRVLIQERRLNELEVCRGRLGELALLISAQEKTVWENREPRSSAQILLSHATDLSTELGKYRSLIHGVFKTKYTKSDDGLGPIETNRYPKEPKVAENAETERRGGALLEGNTSEITFERNASPRHQTPSKAKVVSRRFLSFGLKLHSEVKSKRHARYGAWLVLIGALGLGSMFIFQMPRLKSEEINTNRSIAPLVKTVPPISATNRTEPSIATRSDAHAGVTLWRQQDMGAKGTTVVGGSEDVTEVAASQDGQTKNGETALVRGLADARRSVGRRTSEIVESPDAIVKQTTQTPLALDAPQLKSHSVAKVGEGMVVIKGGKLWFGLTEEQKRLLTDACRAVFGGSGKRCKKIEGLQTSLVAVAPLKSYALDALEVSYYDYDKCVNNGVCSKPKHPWNRAHLPVSGVSSDNAAQFCAWNGKRLPTREEWMFAIRGDGGTQLFPWGDALPSGRVANFGRWNGEPSPDEGDGHRYAAPVRRRNTSMAKDKIEHLVGNLREIVVIDPRPRYGVVGGSYLSSRFEGHVMGIDLIRAEKNATDIGFRCAVSLD